MPNTLIFHVHRKYFSRFYCFILIFIHRKEKHHHSSNLLELNHLLNCATIQLYLTLNWEYFVVKCLAWMIHHLVNEKWRFDKIVWIIGIKFERIHNEHQFLLALARWHAMVVIVTVTKQSKLNKIIEKCSQTLTDLIIWEIVFLNFLRNLSIKMICSVRKSEVLFFSVDSIPESRSCFRRKSTIHESEATKKRKQRFVYRSKYSHFWLFVFVFIIEFQFQN